jgi:hypothetical protein
MRLLELRDSSTTIERKPAALLQKSVKKLASSERALKRPSALQVSAAARVFPINPNAVQSQIQRRPAIDLEQLQQRIDLLEQRIHARLSKQSDVAWKDELEQLRNRMKILERKLETELWAAKQREYTLLEMLAKPARKTAIMRRLMCMLNEIPATVWRWFKVAGKEWWLDSQPLWWPKLSDAWQEAMLRARR